MKSFEKDIKKRIIWITLFAVLGGLAVIIAFVIKLNLSGGIEADSGLPVVVLIGFFAGMEFTSIYRIIRYRKALNQDKTLEALHIKETDERNRMISLKTCKSCIYLAFILLGFAGIITAFFNRTVFLTIGIVLIVLLALYAALALYYSRRF
ncbi:MAG: hypothetical protein ACRDBO_21475 [Lachnospiraceae bacterium]